MKNLMKYCSLRSALSLWFPLAGCFIALNHANATPDNFEFVATVNGFAISKGLFELNLQAAIAQGQKDTPQLRDAIKNELINRQLIAQEVVKQGLEQGIDLQDQITQLRQNLYLQAFIEDYLKKNPITNERLREEYDKQKQYLGNGSDSATQYKISQIVLKSESESIAVISRLQSGDSFAKVAKEVSLDAATKSQGGVLGWVSPQQLAPPIADVVGTLGKGAYSKVPIKISDAWVIMRVDDTRSAKIPNFEASKNQLKQAIIQQYLTETLKRLRESSRIVQ
ncbi:peptidyl-prolyl cis-trans isomerase C [Polynucleobacter sphagniphilus]|uniref:peptidylprolyl isomerase n=2 Tax=Polynucleobacter TaxID=44013 RepID=UPI002474C0A7|nr:peptidylprolyl isomerase [Polynucleobacter sphagniphilus]MDH6302621.1 peptidyl-prolyl cis-trans isomerase C [Polynucleobacter sphagniphilus]